ncbi:MAG: GatB/YqeY domain-containing protein [Candidatus Omnitrophica bacterium]|nr:GatB/YqeY domain-containing protein [Candidatus Omnitrophota bacterium]
MLIEKIEADLKSALKQKDTLRTSVLRLLKAAITNKLVEKNSKEIDDSEIISLIRKDAARHQDSITQFRNGKRDDLAAKEAAELEILKSYLPKEPSQEEIKSVVKNVIVEINASGKKDFGKVIKASMEKLKNSCDGKVLSSIVSELLGTS